MSTLIKSWDDLKKILQESDTHILEIKEYSGWLRAKDEKDYNPEIDYMEQIKHLDVYLHTHTFYEDNCEFYTKVLQICGFDVELVNYDDL